MLLCWFESNEVELEDIHLLNLQKCLCKCIRVVVLIFELFSCYKCELVWLLVNICSGIVLSGLVNHQFSFLPS